MRRLIDITGFGQWWITCVDAETGEIVELWAEWGWVE